MKQKSRWKQTLAKLMPYLRYDAERGTLEIYRKETANGSKQAWFTVKPTNPNVHTSRRMVWIPKYFNCPQRVIDYDALVWFMLSGVLYTDSIVHLEYHDGNHLNLHPSNVTFKSHRVVMCNDPDTSYYYTYNGKYCVHLPHQQGGKHRYKCKAGFINWVEAFNFAKAFYESRGEWLEITGVEAWEKRTNKPQEPHA